MGIYASIKDWETERLGGMKDELKDKYVQAVKEELAELKQEFEKVPASDDNSSKRWRLNADVLQTEWRLGYIANLVRKGS